MDAAAKILIVEGDHLVRLNIADYLIEAGYEVLEASDTDEAIAIIEAVSGIDLVFTDVDMPGAHSGLTLAETVANRWPPIRIIVTSGKVQVDLDALPAGSRFCAKPYSFQRITGTIQSLMV